MKKERKTLGVGCILAFSVLLLFVGVALTIVAFVGQELIFGYNHDLDGKIVTSAYVPGKGSKAGRAWVLTDPSFYYMFEQETPGHNSISRECFACKLHLTILDPATQKVALQHTWKYDDNPPEFEMVYTNRSVWLIAKAREGQRPRVMKYKASSGKRSWSTKTFTKKHPELKAGLSEVKLIEDNTRLAIKTRDGLEFIYTLHDNTLVEKDARATSKAGTKSLSMFVLGKGKTDARKKLFRVTAPESQHHKLKHGLLLTNKAALRALDATVEPVAEKEVFLDGWILTQNKKFAVIAHQDSIGNRADRTLTCIDAKGRSVWSIPQTELFYDLAVDIQNNPFSKTVFVKSRLSGELHDTMFVLHLKDEGLIGFDMRSGAFVWALSNT